MKKTLINLNRKLIISCRKITPISEKAEFNVTNSKHSVVRLFGYTVKCLLFRWLLTDSVGPYYVQLKS